MTLAFKILSTGSPAYLLPAVSNYIPTRHLRTSSQLLLSKPAVRTETARRSFNQAAPSVWNSLPVEIRVSETARQFRTAIRTHTYRLAFNYCSRDCLRSHDSTVTRRLKERHQKHLIIIIIISSANEKNEDEWGDLECLYKSCQTAVTVGLVHRHRHKRMRWWWMARVKMTTRWETWARSRSRRTAAARMMQNRCPLDTGLTTRVAWTNDRATGDKGDENAIELQRQRRVRLRLERLIGMESINIHSISIEY